jgi:tetratricopeptide (TPR) repeat protein
MTDAGRDGAFQVWDLREIRRQLKEIGLDWDRQSYPPPPDSARPLRVRVLAAEPPPPSKELDAQAYRERGLVYLQLRLYQIAMADFNQARALDPERPPWEEAIAEWKKVIEMDAKNAVAHYYFGLALQAMGDLDGAERAYLEAVRLDGKHGGAAIDALAGLLLSRGNAPAGLATARKAVELAPQSSMAWQMLGWAHYRTGDWRASVEALEKSCALQDNPKGGDSFQWFFLAMAHWQLGAKDKARELYDRAVEWMDKNQPKNEELRRFRAEAAQLLELKEKK